VGIGESRMPFKSKVWKNPDKYKCPECGSISLRLDGKQTGKQRYECKRCGTKSQYPKGVKK